MKTNLPAPPTRLREDLIHPDPLLDSLVEVCRLHGRGASRASLSGGLPLVDGRLTLIWPSAPPHAPAWPHGFSA